MAGYKRKNDYFTSEEGVEIAQLLSKMASDDSYNTEPSYSANSDLYPDNEISFVDKHISYLRTHPSIDPHHYLSNLKLMTRKR
jgi:hypothetical protein